MDALAQNIINIAKLHPEYESLKDKVIEEFKFFDRYDLFNNVYSLYLSLKKSNRTGDINSLNSVVLYILGITAVKPTKDFKLNERRTYARAGWPDVDMDFDPQRRSEIMDYLIGKYGREYVANIGVVQKLHAKSAVRRAVKVLEADFSLENEIASQLPFMMKRPDGTDIDTVEESYEEFSDFRQYMDQYPRIYDAACAVQGTVSATGIHPGGVVISPEPLARTCPLHVTGKGKQKVIGTQFSMDDVERMGLIKFDILGLSTISAFDLACQFVYESVGKTINWMELPLDDKKTFELITTGKTWGCFQLEEFGMQRTLQEIVIETFEHLIIAIAMYRPGPKQYIKELARRKSGQKSVSYAHPLMKSITENTYGILAFQEQIMQAFMQLSGLTASDGYMFIKGSAKKKPEIVASYKGRFFKGCASNNIPEQTVNKIWKDLEKFAGYSFNRAHAASYALLSYKTAYLKAHYPAEFMAARLSVAVMCRKFKDEFDTVGVYEKDAKENLGINILPADVDKSKIHYTIVDQKTIRG